MDLKQFAMHMYPFWILGIGVICAVMSTKEKGLIRIEKKTVLNWLKLLILVTAIRFLLYKVASHSIIFRSVKGVTMLPIGVALTVFWEDAVHGLPLLILRNLIGINRWTKPLHALLLLIVMVEFGIGHLYQGPFAALTLSLYVPASIKLGEKHGFGTIMIGHVLYDLFTIGFVKYIIGV